MRPEQPPETQSEQKTYRCILIDDDQWALMDIKKVMPFKEEGFLVIGEYGSAAEALSAIDSLRPDLVISDICLGGMSGLDMIAACKKKNFAGEFILISGYADFEYARQAINADVGTYLLKPLDFLESKFALQKARAKLDGQPQQYDDQQHTIEKIRDYIRSNYNQRLSLDEVADLFYINRTYLSEAFRERFGKNFVQYKNEVRIGHAKILLTDTRLSISEIALQCGFENTSYFALVFRQMTGQTPGQFRK